MPQSIAYAAIADLPPHVGLYTSIMGSFVYIFFGTVKQVSIGPSSILSLLTATYIHGKPTDYLVLLTFFCGIVELLMGILNLGILVDFISSPVTSAFTSATSSVIILAQLKNIFGITFKSIGTYDLIKQTIFHIKNLKYADTSMGIISMIILLSIKKISQKKFQSPGLNKAIWYLSICRNALVVLVASIIAFVFHESETVPFRIVGKVTPGLPTFRFPVFSSTDGNRTVEFMEMMGTLGTGIFVLPVVAVLANVAIAKTFADGTVFDAGQEMMTLGISNIMGSFVGSMPTTGAFTRSAVNNASNVQTPLGGLYVGTMILLALSFLTPYFYFIPKSAIAAVLICAVMFMIEYWELPKLWRCNKYDFCVWITTFIVSLVKGVELGIVVGVILNTILLLKIWARPKIYSDIRMNERGEKYLLIKPELGWCFPSVNYVTQELLTLSARYNNVPIVMDLRYVLRLDYTGCQCMAQNISTFKKKERQFVIINIKPGILKQLKKLMKSEDINVKENVNDVFDEIFSNSKVSDIETPLLHNNVIMYNDKILNNGKRPSIYDNL